jgi:hypothetical protein
LLEGAPIETLFQSELSEDVAVLQEIEALQRGEPVAPLITDNHPMYIRAYQKLLYNPSIRQNGPMVQSVLSLMMERAQLEMQCPPDIKAMLRGLPMPQMGMTPQGAMPTSQPPSNPSEAVAPQEQVNGNAAMPAQPQTGV